MRNVCPPSSSALTLVQIAMLSFSSSRAVTAVRHHLVALEVATAADPTSANLTELDRNPAHPALE